MKHLRFLFLLIAAVMLLSACADEIPETIVSRAPVATDAPPVQEPYPISFDNETFESAPATVASLSPAITEMLFDIGAQDRLVAVSDYCDYPAATEYMQKTGSPAKPDAAALTALAPELLITMSPIAATEALQLRQAGIRVLEISEPTSFAELCEIYIKLSMIFYGAADSPAVATNVLSGIDGLMYDAQHLGISKTFVIVEDYADSGLMLSPADTLCSEMLSVYGSNIWDGDSYTVTDEELFEIGPDVVFYAAGLDEGDIEKTFPHSQLIEIDFQRFERPTVRLGDLIAQCGEELAE